MSTTNTAAAGFSSSILDNMKKYNMEFDPIVATPIFKYIALIDPLTEGRVCYSCTGRLVDLAWTALQRYMAADKAAGILAADESCPSHITHFGWHCHTDDPRNSVTDRDQCGCDAIAIYTTFSGPEQALDLVEAFAVYDCLAENSRVEEVEKLVGFLGSDKPEEWTLDQLKLWFMLAGSYTCNDAVNGRDVPDWLLNHRRFIGLRQDEILARFHANPDLTTNRDFLDLARCNHFRCYCYPLPARPEELRVDGPFRCRLEDASPSGIELLRGTMAFNWATRFHADNGPTLRALLAGNGSYITPEAQEELGSLPSRQSVDRENWSTNVREKLMEFASENGWADLFLDRLAQTVCQPWREDQDNRNRDSEVQIDHPKGPDAVFKAMNEYIHLLQRALDRIYGYHDIEDFREVNSSDSDSSDSDLSDSDPDFSDSDFE